MRIGLIGPGEDDEEALREAIEFLLGDVDVDQIIYVGADDATIDRVLEAWIGELLGGVPGQDAFLASALDRAIEGTPQEIEALLTAEAAVQRLSRVRKLPPPPARAVEMLADRIIIAVYDKSILDEEDIANAQLIVYGKSPVAVHRRFGPRYFLTPGPVSGGQVGVLEVEEDGHVSLALFETSGVPVWRETMAARTSKLHVVQ